MTNYKILACLYLNRQWGGQGLNRETLVKLWGRPSRAVIGRLLKSRSLHCKPSSDRNEIINLNYLGENELLERFPLLGFLDVNGQRSNVSWASDPGSGVRPQGKIRDLTLVIFNIPESQRASRDRLRYRLKSLGFGALSRSVYLTPHWSVKETKSLVEGLARPRLANGAVVMGLPGDSLQEVEEPGIFWRDRLSFCSEEYERALAAWEVSKSASKFLNYFIAGLLADPLLPPPLQPKTALINECLPIAKDIIVS